MVIIDEIHIPDRPPLFDILGGSASFVTLGQRLFATRSAEVGCLVIAGDDFPATVERQLEEWGTTTVVRSRKGRHSTRGKLTYEDDTFGPKTFAYQGEPLRALPTDLASTPLLHAKAFHFFGTPEEVLTQIPELIQLRAKEGTTLRPLLVWEPLPLACTTENRDLFLQACRLVDVFSPNHIEVAKIVDENPPQIFDAGNLESYGQSILDSGIGPSGNGTVIIRAGENGALSMSRTSRATWFPSYYGKGSSEVVDPTGAGNTFLGGYIAGLQRTGDEREAMYYGHIAASYALEQIGLPELEFKGDGVLCNGIFVMNRLHEYKERLVEAKVKSEHVL